MYVRTYGIHTVVRYNIDILRPDSLGYEILYTPELLFEQDYTVAELKLFSPRLNSIKWLCSTKTTFLSSFPGTKIIKTANRKCRFH
jgi:hypothetical protein